MGFLQSLSIATLCLSLLYTGSNANLIERQVLSSPATLPTGWSYRGCYTYGLLYPSLVAVQGRSSATDDHAGTLLVKDRYKLPLLQATTRAPENVLSTVLLPDTL